MIPKLIMICCFIFEIQIYIPYMLIWDISLFARNTQAFYRSQRVDSVSLKHMKKWIEFNFNNLCTVIVYCFVRSFFFKLLCNSVYYLSNFNFLISYIFAKCCWLYCSFCHLFISPSIHCKLKAYRSTDCNYTFRQLRWW